MGLRPPDGRIVESVELLHLWHLLAGIVGAFGNQVIYWGNRLRRPDLPMNRRMIPISVAYVATGGGIGFFVGVSTGQSMDLILLSLGSGAFWPETLKALDAARRVTLRLKQKIEDSGDSLDPSSGAAGGR